jgi:hypothetical protein
LCFSAAHRLIWQAELAEHAIRPIAHD